MNVSEQILLFAIIIELHKKLLMRSLKQFSFFFFSLAFFVLLLELS